MQTAAPPDTFARILEIARAALAGTECLTLTLRYGLAMPPDRLVLMAEAVDTARRELNALEQWAAGGKSQAVH